MPFDLIVLIDTVKPYREEQLGSITDDPGPPVHVNGGCNRSASNLCSVIVQTKHRFDDGTCTCSSLISFVEKDHGTSVKKKPKSGWYPVHR